MKILKVASAKYVLLCYREVNRKSKIMFRFYFTFDLLKFAISFYDGTQLYSVTQF